MPIRWEQEEDALIVIRVNGRVTVPEYRENQATVAPIIRLQGITRLLARLDDFKGWEGSEGWEDMSFMEENDRYLKRLAIVGDEKWRDQVLMFMLAGLRPVDIQYFSLSQEQEARKWLLEG